MRSGARLPREFDSRALGLICLLVAPGDHVPAFEVPGTLALRHVIVKAAFEIGPVAVLPLALLHLALKELTNVLLPGSVENVGSLSLLLSLAPVAGVNVLVLVGHHSLSVTLVFTPVSVVGSHALVNHFANSAFQVVAPLSAVNISRLFGVGNSMGIDALSMAHLKGRYAV